MENKNKIKNKTVQNETDTLNGLKQFIRKNKKENMVLRNILKKMNESLEKKNSMIDL